jgi:hypothetical protein
LPPLEELQAESASVAAPTKTRAKNVDIWLRRLIMVHPTGGDLQVSKDHLPRQAESDVNHENNGVNSWFTVI